MATLTNTLVSEWTKKTRLADEFSDEMRADFLVVFPTKKDFEDARQDIYDSILCGFSEQDQINYFISSQYLNQRNKTPDVLKYTRIRNSIKKKIYRFYDKLCVAMYYSESTTTDETNISMRDIFRYVDDEENEVAEKVGDKVGEQGGEQVLVSSSRAFVPESVIHELSAKLSAMNAALEEEEERKEPDTFSVEEMLEISEGINQELQNSIICPVCLDIIVAVNEEVICCFAHGHPIHLMCRWNMAKSKKHKCPTCNEFCEEDQGREFCRTFGIVRRNNRTAVVVAASSSIVTRSRKN